jgi:hypothetical protein
MNQPTNKYPSTFSVRKVSVDQAIKVLRRNGIRANKDEAEIILDFLYLIANTYKNRQNVEIITDLNLTNNSNT